MGNNASNNFEGGYVYSSGIYLSSSSNNILSGNDASNNKNGIYLYYSNNNTLRGNHASNNNIGISVSSSSNNTLTNNNPSNNGYYGIRLSSSINNKIYNNIFNNTKNFRLSKINIWNTTKQSGTNIIGGSLLGGNFWANPEGTGFSQTCEDVNGDGICDKSYALNAKNIDYLPLANDKLPPRSVRNLKNITYENSHRKLTLFSRQF